MRDIGGYWNNADDAGATDAAQDGAGPRHNSLAMLLPYLERGAIYEIFDRGIAPWDANATQPGSVPMYVCPSDASNSRQPGHSPNASRANMALSMGDVTSCRNNNRGLFTWATSGGPGTWSAYRHSSRYEAERRRLIRPKDMGAVSDGTSNTIFCSEFVIGNTSNGRGSREIKGGAYHYGNEAFATGMRANVGMCVNNAIDRAAGQLVGAASEVGRGARYFDRWDQCAYFNTLAPPNAPVCVRNNNERDHWGVLSPQSRHSGGVNAGLVDGSVRFITDSIDTNNLGGSGVFGGHPEHSGRSIYGTWGALGSINGGESATL